MGLPGVLGCAAHLEQSRVNLWQCQAREMEQLEPETRAKSQYHKAHLHQKIVTYQLLDLG